jgi:SOS response regulatory protein OraA/RecX
MFYDATGKTKEQIIEELSKAGISEYDIGIVLKHIELGERYNEIQEKFNKKWNKYEQKRKIKSKLLKEEN